MCCRCRPTRTPLRRRPSKEIDVKLIDDTSPQDRDASAVLSPSVVDPPANRDAFARLYFLSPGGDAGMVISMAWLCRTKSAHRPGARGTGAFQNCQLTRYIGLPDDATLTDLTVTLASGALKVHAAVR